MAKAKTSRKPKSFSIDDMEIVSLKPGVKTERHDPNESLSDPDFIMEALIECLFDNDLEAFKEIIKAHYEAVNITRALKDTGLSKRTFFDAISPRGNPRLSTITKLMAGIRPKTKSKRAPKPFDMGPYLKQNKNGEIVASKNIKKGEMITVPQAVYQALPIRARKHG